MKWKFQNSRVCTLNCFPLEITRKKKNISLFNSFSSGVSVTIFEGKLLKIFYKP